MFFMIFSCVCFQDAATSDIRRSYRKLSLVMHPDKNKTEGAEENFRILVAMYEVSLLFHHLPLFVTLKCFNFFELFLTACE